MASIKIITTDDRLLELFLSRKCQNINTKRAYNAATNSFILYLCEHALSLKNVTMVVLESYYEQLVNKELSQSSINHKMNVIKSLLSFGQKVGYLPFNVGAGFEVKNVDARVYERTLTELETFKLMQSYRNSTDKAVLELLYVSGMRVSELCGLKWSDIVEKGDDLVLNIVGKGSKYRAVLVPAYILNDMEKTCEYVFHTANGKRLSECQVRRLVEICRKRANIDKKVSPHWFRHAHASHALDNGAPLHLIQSTLGHSSIATTSVYLHANPTESSGKYIELR